jgi:hypothetical protein
VETLMERLTTTEAAVAAGVSIPQINRIIDEKILPEGLYSTSPIRTFRTDACLMIAFYFETAEWLTASARLETIRNAMAHCSTWDQWKDCTVGEHFLTVHFSDLWRAVDGRLRRLSEARRMVAEDPEILSGTPVIRGTRVGETCRDLLQNSDRPCVFMAIRKLCRVVKNQNREAVAGGESFSRGCKVAGQNIGFTDPIVAKEAIGSLGIRPVLTCPWGRGSHSARQLLQQLSRSLAVAEILELASHHFIFYPLTRPEIRRRFPAFLALNQSALPHARYLDMHLGLSVST